MIAKLTKSERKRLRDERKELQIIVKHSRKLGFNYIVVREAPAKICFGTTTERECLPTYGPSMSSFMRRFVEKVRPHPGPGDYEICTSLIKKFPALKGYDGLAKRAPRTTFMLHDIAPPVGHYELSKPNYFKQCPRPFGVGVSLHKTAKFLTPPPGCYNFHKRKINVNEAFLSQRIIISAVKIVCSPLNLAKCIICEEQPLGDYWHCNLTNRDMCRKCMEKELRLVKYNCKERMTTQKRKRRNELERFKLHRYCGFHHDHNGTTAAVRLLTKQQLLKKIRTENYLTSFGL